MVNNGWKIYWSGWKILYLLQTYWQNFINHWCLQMVDVELDFPQKLFLIWQKNKQYYKASIADCRKDIIMKTPNPECTRTFHIQYEQWPQKNQAADDPSIVDSRRDVIVQKQNHQGSNMFPHSAWIMTAKQPSSWLSKYCW